MVVANVFGGTQIFQDWYEFKLDRYDVKDDIIEYQFRIPNLEIVSYSVMYAMQDIIHISLVASLGMGYNPCILKFRFDQQVNVAHVEVKVTLHNKNK